MTDRIRERLKNQGVALTRHAAKVHLERAGVTLSDEWRRDPTSKSNKTDFIKESLKNQAVELTLAAAKMQRNRETNLMNKKFEITNEVVYKGLIKLFINRKFYQDENKSYYKFFRKGEIVSDNDCNYEYEVLQTGIFKKVAVFTGEKINLDKPDDYRWMWHCSLQDVDFLIPTDQKEMERVFANIMFMSGMQEK